jgi:cobalt transporter subunit CbtA
MIGRVLLAALLAGIAAGLVMSALQAWKVTPLIIAAEAVFEGNGTSADGNSADDTSADGHAHEGEAAKKAEGSELKSPEAEIHSHDPGAAWMPHNGFQRTTATILSNIIAGVAFSLILTGVVIFTGIEISTGSGAILGLLGFCVFSLAPAFGLPPNLPGVPAAELFERQVWWWATVAATGLGIWMIARLDMVALKILGAAIILLPHVIGAPQPEDVGTEISARLAAQFSANSLVTSALFWAVLGALLGWLLTRQNFNKEAN